MLETRLIRETVGRKENSHRHLHSLNVSLKFNSTNLQEGEMESFNLSLEEQEEISVEGLAGIIFKILKLNFEGGRKRGYGPGALRSIMTFELCHDQEENRPNIHRDFEGKFYEAVQNLKNDNLIMKDPKQASGYVVLITEGKQKKPDDIILFGKSSEDLIRQIKTSIGKLDQIIELYLSESIDTLKKGFIISSAISLGVMSERCILLLAEKIKEDLDDPQITNAYNGCKFIKQYWTFVKDNIRPLKRRYPGINHIEYELDVKVDFLFQNYRLTRNEAGHPEFITDIDPYDQALRIKTVPKYLESIYAVLNL